MRTLITIILISFYISSLNAQEQKITIEEFDDNSRNWPIYNNTGYESYIKSGQYYVNNKSSNSGRYFFFKIPLDSDKDYSIEIKITKQSGENTKYYGLIWGYFNTQNHYDFLISSDGYRMLHAKQDGKISYVEKKSQQDSSFIHPEGTPNVLRLEKTNNQIDYFINDQKVFSTDPFPKLGPKIGFFMDKNTTVQVDYIKVKRYVKSINLVESQDQAYQLENLGPKINSKYMESVPRISPDGKTIYIVRKHPENFGGENYEDIWVSHLDQEGNWTELKNVGKPLNNNTHNSVISISPDGNSLLLANAYKRNGAPDGQGVSLAIKRRGKWKVPVKQEIKNFHNKNKYVSYFLTTDGTKLIMAIENHKSLGEKDLFISFLQKNNTWSEPQNMGNIINTFDNEFAPFLAPDGKTLYFSSAGHPGYGSNDIFLSKRLDDTWLNWSEPQNLGPNINSEGWESYYCVSAIGDQAYVVSNKKDLTLGNMDIFRIRLSESNRPDPVALVQGKVFNQKTQKPIEAQIFYENLNTNKQEGKAYATIEDGYKIALPKGTSYGFRAEADGFFAVSENINLDSLEAFTEKEVNLYLVPIEKGQTFRLNNIFFDTNKAILRNESLPELDRLLDLLNHNNSIKIEIAGHTDNQGTPQYNVTLSTNRAKVVVEYLTKKGISSNRLSYKGYGESKPVATNQTEEGRQLNRRVEFVIQ